MRGMGVFDMKPDWINPKRYKKYNFHTMEVGELRVIEKDAQGCKDIKSFRALVWNRSRQLGYTLHCRARDDGAYEVYRSE